MICVDLIERKRMAAAVHSEELDALDLFLDPVIGRWLANFSHHVLGTTPLSENTAITGCGWFQWFFAAISVALRKGYRIPPRTRGDLTRLTATLQTSKRKIVEQRTHDLHDFIVNFQVDPTICKPYGYTVNHPVPDRTVHEAMCFVRRIGSVDFMTHYFTHIHTPDRGDWILSAYGSCYVKIPGSLMPVDPTVWEEFVQAFGTSTEEAHSVIRSFMMTYFLQGSFELLHDNVTTSNETLYGMPITNGAERELAHIYDPNQSPDVTYALYIVRDYEDYLQLPSLRGGGRRTKKRGTRKRSGKRSSKRNDTSPHSSF
jgi:hypothetical protein